MIRIIIIVFFGICFSSCKNKKDISTTTETETKGDYTLTGYVTSSRSWCGGMRPTDEMLLEITAAKPLANATFYIREGKVNDTKKKIIATIITNSDGKFEVNLPKGDYVIINDDKKEDTYFNSILKNYSKETAHYSSVDTVCLKEWMKTPLIQFTLDSTKKINITWNIYVPCSWGSVPCCNYLGPYPP